MADSGRRHAVQSTMQPSSRMSQHVVANPLNRKTYRSSTVLKQGLMPDRDKAMEYAVLKHPHVEDIEGKFKQLPFCLRTGRFVPRSCLRAGILCDFFLEGKASELKAYGAGVTGWFKLMKLLIGLFVVQVLLAVPVMVILGHSKYYEDITSSATSDLARFTLGNFDVEAHLSPAACKAFESTGLLSSSDECTVSASQASDIIIAFECFGVLAAALAFAWLKRFRPKEDRDVGLSSLGADAFTVYFPWAPPTADPTAPELRKHVEKCLFEFSGKHHPVREIALIENSFSLIDLFQSVGVLRRKLERLQTQHAQLRWERGDVWRHGSLGQYDELAAKEGFDFRSDSNYSVGTAEGAAVCCCLNRSERIERLECEMLRVAAEQKHVKQEALRETKLGQQLHTFSVRGAFVTFETLDAKELAQHIFADKWGFKCCRPGNLRLQYEYLGQLKSRIPRAKRAPPPDVINWPSFALSGKVVTIRRCGTFIASLCIVLLSFVMTVTASVSQRTLQVPERDCSMTQAPPANAPFNTTLAAEIGSDCLCAAVPWKRLSLSAMKSHSYRSYCTDEFCPALVANSFGELRGAQDCQDWLQDYITLSSLTVGAAMVTVGINLLLVVCMNRLVQREAHKSKSSANKSYSERLFTMQFLNMVGVPLVVNAAFTVPEDLQVVQGEAFHDTVPRWYATVGAALVLTTVLNAFIPHIIVLVRYIVLRCRRSAESAASQTDLNLSFVGPEWNPAKRIAQLMNTVAVCMIFSPSIPILSVIGLCSVGLFYWVEVFAFVRLQRTPPHYDTQLLKLTNALFPIILGRIMFALWSIGSSSVLNTDAVYEGSFLRSADGGSCDWAAAVGQHHATNDGSSLSLNSISAGLVARMCNGHTLPLWILALLLFLIACGMFAVRSCGRCVACMCQVATCGACSHTGQPKRKHKANLYNSTFSQLAQQPKDGSRAVLSGVLSYNILHNDDYRQQFGYDSNFLNGLDSTGMPIKYPGWRPRSLLDLHYFDAMAASGSVTLARRRRRSRAASLAGSPTHTAAALAAAPPPLLPHAASDSNSNDSSDDEFRAASSRSVLAVQPRAQWPSQPTQPIRGHPPAPSTNATPLPCAQRPHSVHYTRTSAISGLSAPPLTVDSPLSRGGVPSSGEGEAHHTIIVDDSSGSFSSSAESSSGSSSGSDDVFCPPPPAGGQRGSRSGRSSGSASTPDMPLAAAVCMQPHTPTSYPTGPGAVATDREGRGPAAPGYPLPGATAMVNNPLRHVAQLPANTTDSAMPSRARNALSGYFVSPTATTAASAAAATTRRK